MKKSVFAKRGILLFLCLGIATAANSASADDDFDLPLHGDEWLTKKCLPDAQIYFGSYQQGCKEEETKRNLQIQEYDLMIKKQNEATEFLNNNRDALQKLEDQFHNHEISQDDYDLKAKNLLEPLSKDFNNVPGHTVCESEEGPRVCSLVKRGWNREITYRGGQIFIVNTNLTLSSDIFSNSDSQIIKDYKDMLNANVDSIESKKARQDWIDKTAQGAATNCSRVPTEFENCMKLAKENIVETDRKKATRLQKNKPVFEAIVKIGNHPYRDHRKNNFWQFTLPIGPGYNVYQSVPPIYPNDLRAVKTWNDYALEWAKKYPKCVSPKVTKLRQEIAHDKEVFQAQSKALGQEICRIEKNADVLEKSIALSKQSLATLLKLKAELNTNQFDEAIARIQAVELGQSQRFCSAVDAEGASKAGDVGWPDSKNPGQPIEAPVVR